MPNLVNLFITLNTIDITNTTKKPKQLGYSRHIQANMQFSKVFLVAATVASASAAPTGDLEARTSGGIQCQKHEGKWKYGWEGAAPSEKYTCATSGLINILTCVNVLNGNTVNVDLLSILGL